MLNKLMFYKLEYPNEQFSQINLSEFENERLRSNIYHEVFLSYILIIAVVLTFIINYIGINLNIFKLPVVNDNKYYYLGTMIIAIIYIFLIKTFKVKDKNTPVLKFFHSSFCFINILVASFYAILTPASYTQLAPYYMFLLWILSTVILDKIESLFIITVPLIIIVIGISYTNISKNSLITNLLFCFFTYIITYTSSQMNYITHRNEYLIRHVITSKNEDLTVLRATLEEVVATRTSELTKIREYEELRGFFFANISHELRTPLNLIFSSVQILERTCSLNNKQEKYTDLIKQNCYRLMKTINNIIDLTKLDSNHEELSPKNYDIVRTVEDITASVSDYANNKGIEIIFDTEIEEQTLAFDIDKMERVMLNLLSNAIKFTENGGNITVKTYIKDNMFCISVKDTGIGVPADKIPLVFDRFVQVDPSIRRCNEGSGIGLSLVKSLVDMHGGIIQLNSTLGEGSEFIIMLPMIILPEKGNETTSYKGVPIEKVIIEFSDL